MDNHDESQWPFIWELLDKSGKRLTVIVKHTEADALDLATRIYGTRLGAVVNTGKRKPPNKCCNKCGDKPCS